MSDEERTSLLRPNSRPASVQSPDTEEYEQLVDLDDEKKVEIDVLTCSGSHIICQSQELSSHDIGSHMT